MKRDITKVLINFCFVYILFFFQNCSRFPCVEYGTGRTLSHEIVFYFSEKGATNDYWTYSYNLIITNHKKGEFSLKELSEIARQYSDSVKADLPVSRVSFAFQSPGGCLPNPDDTYNKARNNVKVSFSFDNSFPYNATKKEKKLDMVTIYNGETKRYEPWNTNLDSLLRARDILF